MMDSDVYSGKYGKDYILTEIVALVCARPVSPVMMRREQCFVSGSISTVVLGFQLTATKASIVGRPRHHGYESSRSSLLL